MIRSIKNLVWKLLNVIGIGGSVQLYLESTLKDSGWFKSYHSKRSVDADGAALPWYTYSFIAFLKPRIKNHFEVFEYGSGNSTKWYGARVHRILAVENDANWIEIMKPSLPPNASVLNRALGEDYIQAIGEIPDRSYHIIVVDGRNRVKCTDYAAQFLTDDGVLILDNSERPFYQKAKDIMAERGFRRIDFYGMAPIVSHETCSSVFYRDNNCLGI